MTRRRWVALALVLALFIAAGVAVVVVSSRSSSPAAVLPASMAAAGDSITQAFDLNADHLLQDSPAESWSTGTDPAVDSQYDRILAAQRAIAGHGYNDARVGAKMAALAGQLQVAATQRVAYVTVLMGANDVCTPSVASMTPTATFESEFNQALSGFWAADPAALVFVASIPDVYQLWQTLQANPRAELTWTLAHICQSMLEIDATAADRQAVAAREQADNAALAAVCRRYAHCRDDGGAVYREQFSPADVSSVDFFHPSLLGQEALAQVTWAAGYWPGTR